MVTCTGEREIGAVHETVMAFLTPDVKKKKKNSSFYCLFCLTLLLTASNVIFWLGSIRPKSNLEGFEWSGAWISQRQLNFALTSRPLRYCSFQNILTNSIISQIDTLPYFISYYSSAITINSTTTTPNCTLLSVLLLLLLLWKNTMNFYRFLQLLMG